MGTTTPKRDLKVEIKKLVKTQPGMLRPQDVEAGLREWAVSREDVRLALLNLLVNAEVQMASDGTLRPAA